ncbi:unnamed protein product [Pedinophyceae sp. YPF-701]|nr:unnamed protein product [Pedinophyceae sp. YPF-701]
MAGSRKKNKRGRTGGSNGPSNGAASRDGNQASGMTPVQQEIINTVLNAAPGTTASAAPDGAFSAMQQAFGSAGFNVSNVTMFNQPGGSAPAPGPAPSAPRKASQSPSQRQATISEHNAALAQFNSVRNRQGYGAVLPTTPAGAPNPGRRVPPVSSCTPVRVGELRSPTATGTVHDGKVLRGTLVVSPFQVRALQTVLEDEVGDVIKCGIYNPEALAEGGSPLHAFRQGRKVAIVEPLYKVFADTSTGVRVDNPKSVVFEDSEAPQERAKSPEKLKSAEEYRAEGNELFVGGQYAKAVASYTSSLERHDADKVLSTTLLNLSATELARDRPLAALAMAMAGRAVDPKNPKAYFRAATALERLDLTDAGLFMCDQTRRMTVGKRDLAVEELLGRMKQRGGRPAGEQEALRTALRLMAKEPGACFPPQPSAADEAKFRAIEAKSEDELAPLRAEGKASGNDLYKSGDYELAGKEYRDVLAHFPGAAAVLSNRAMCRLKSGEPLQAVSDAAASMCLRAGHAKAQYRFACALLDLGWRKEAALAPIGALDAEARSAITSRLGNAAGGQPPAPDASAGPSQSSAPPPAPESDDFDDSGPEVPPDTAFEAENADVLQMTPPPDALRAMGIHQPVPRRDIRAYHRSYERAGQWPAHCDVAACRALIAQQRKMDILTNNDLVDLYASLSSHPAMMSAAIPARLGVRPEDALTMDRVQWWLQAQVGDVRFHARPLISPQVHETVLEPSVPALLRPAEKLHRGDIHVGVGFLDLSWIAQAAQMGFAPARDESRASEPVRWVGFDACSYNVAKAAVIIEMMQQASAGQGQGVARDVLQVWYSTSWTKGALARFREAVKALVDDPAMASWHPKSVMEYLTWWRHHDDVSLRAARRTFVEEEGITAKFGNWKLKRDCHEHITYALTGEVGGSGEVGSPVVWALPPGTPRVSKTETIFDSVGIEELSAKMRTRSDSVGAVSVVTDILLDRIQAMADAVAGGALSLEVEHACVEKRKRGVAERIASMRPTSMSWSNCCDLFGPKEFHALARACSAPGGTRHYLQSVFWVRDVKGAFVLDYDQREDRWRHIDEGAAQVAAAYRADGRDAYMLLPVVETIAGSADFVLMRQYHRRWAERFFAEGGVPPSDWEITAPPQFNVHAQFFGAFAMAFTAHRRSDTKNRSGKSKTSEEGK